MKSVLAKRVRACRENKEMSQERLAKASATTQSSLSRIEHGKLVNVGAQTLIRLADSLDVSVDFLLGRQAEPSVSDALASPRCRRLMERYMLLTEAGQGELLAFAEFLLEKHGKVGGSLPQISTGE